MNWIIYFLITLGIIFIAMILTGIIILQRIRDKTRIRINLLLKSKRWMTKKIRTQDLGKQININNENYIFDEKCIIKGRWIDNIYYYQGDPSPILFDFKKTSPNTYNSKDLKTILDSDLIEKLFNENRLAKMELIIYIMLALSGLTLLATIGGLFLPTNITSDTNQIFIEEIVRKVLTGGR